jgi:hypothetical protein
LEFFFQFSGSIENTETIMAFGFGKAAAVIFLFTNHGAFGNSSLRVSTWSLCPGQERLGGEVGQATHDNIPKNTSLTITSFNVRF